MKTITNNHNKSILGKKPSIDTSTCNFRNKEDCQLKGQCKIEQVVYESTLTVTNKMKKIKKYFEIEEEPFKGRL